MADTTEGDSNVHYLTLLVPALMALIAGLVIQSFIIGVNVNDWWKGRSVTPVDHIVTSLGIIRMCTQCSFTLYLVKMLFRSSLDSQTALLLIILIYNFSTFANIWLTSLLSIVLCLKISNLHTRLFLYVRRMILHRTVYFIVASLLLPALNILMPLWVTITKVTDGGTYNTTMDNLPTDCLDNYSLYCFTIGMFFPLFFYSISSVLLFISLYLHTTRMKMSSNLCINLETYYSAMRFVSFTSVYSTMYFMGHFASVFYYYFYCENLSWLFVIVDFLPALHSSYLIYRTAKLRDQMSKILHNVMDLLFQRKNTDTRENIEMVAL